MQFITRETWSLAFEVKDDLGCSKVILTALEDLVKKNWLQASEATNFSSNLVYDNRVGICFAYDPSHEFGRRL